MRVKGNPAMAKWCGAGLAALAGGLLAAGAAAPAHAVEAARNIYLLGSRSALAGVLPGPGGFFQNDVYVYSGSASANREFEIGGQVVAGADADVLLELPTASWFFAADGAPGLLFGVAGSLPMAWEEVSVDATLSAPNGGVVTGERSQQDFQVGDPYLQAFIGSSSGNWHWNVAGALNVPLGQWEQGSLVNIGFNRWAGDVTGSLTYLDLAEGWQASTALGFTFNGENLDLDYDSGTEMHLEWSLSKFTASGFSFGLAGYYYQQITGDSGSDARLGSFEGRVVALGPVAGLTIPLADRAIQASFRAYHEFAAENRLEGVAAFGSVAIPLQPAAAPK
jgi:hypothetical protein